MLMPASANPVPTHAFLLPTPCPSRRLGMCNAYGVGSQHCQRPGILPKRSGETCKKALRRGFGVALTFVVDLSEMENMYDLPTQRLGLERSSI